MQLALNDLRSILDQAEKAVGREDYAAAERLLREALTIQELNSGKREEVAKTLNNLAIVCEMAGKVPDAEACYRQAYEIAHANLPASDPFVKTSRDNLEEFCRDRGLPMPPPPAPAPAPPPPPAAPPVQASPVTRQPSGASIPSGPPKTAGFVHAPAKVTPPAPAAPARTSAPSAPSTSGTISRPPGRLSSPPAAPAGAARPPQSPPRAQPPAARAASSVPAPRRRSSRASLYVVLGLAGLIAVIAGGRYLFTPEPTSPQPEPASSASADPTAPFVESSAPASQPANSEPPVATTPPPTPAPEPTTPPPGPVAAAPEKPAPPEKPTTPVRAATNLNVLNADLCRNLSTSGAWRCTPATGPQSAGTLTFYTRVAAPRDTTIEHRWYRGDRLQQRVPLRIRPNPSGYRTFSRTRINADAGGDWRVELRTQDGQVLETKNFQIK